MMISSLVILLGSIGLVFGFWANLQEPDNVNRDNEIEVGIGGIVYTNISLTNNQRNELLGNGGLVPEGEQDNIPENNSVGVLDVVFNIRWREVNNTDFATGHRGVINTSLIRSSLAATINNDASLGSLLTVTLVDYSNEVRLNQPSVMTQMGEFEGFIMFRITLSEPTSYQQYRDVVGGVIRINFTFGIIADTI